VNPAHQTKLTTHTATSLFIGDTSQEDFKLDHLDFFLARHCRHLRLKKKLSAKEASSPIRVSLKRDGILLRDGNAPAFLIIAGKVTNGQLQRFLGVSASLDIH
jgi:hypothetical protein